MSHRRSASPGEGWSHSMMAHSFNDPYFQAVMQEEANIFKDLAGLVEDTCLTCHASMGRTHAHLSDPTLLSTENCPLSDGCYRQAQAENEMHAREGVSCTLCQEKTALKNITRTILSLTSIRLQKNI